MPRIRKARSGTVVIEIPGREEKVQAGYLAEKLSGVLGDAAVITRLKIMREDPKILGLKDSITVEELGRVAELDKWKEEEVKVGPINF